MLARKGFISYKGPIHARLVGMVDQEEMVHILCELAGEMDSIILTACQYDLWF